MRADHPVTHRLASIARGARRFARRWSTRRGGVAVMFALAIPVVTALGLVAVDFHRAAGVRLQLQDALDAATLATARSNAMDNTAAFTVGDRVLKANLKGFTQTAMVSDAFTISNGVVSASAHVTVTPLIANLFLGGPMTVGATSEAVRANKRLEIALVLDNTGSMSQNNKLTNLITAADDLVDTMSAAASRLTDPTAIKISLVPFSMTVRVGSTYKTATWIDQTGASPINDEIFTTASGTAHANRFTLMSQMGVTWAGCVESRQSPYDVQDTAPSVATPATLFTPFFAPDEPDAQAKNKNGNFGTFYNNYLTDGSYSSSNWKIPQGVLAKYNAAPKSGTNSSTGYTYGPNAGCQMQSLMRLTTNYASIKTAINAMTAIGDTNIPMGMVWGWHTLSPNAPFADGVAYGTPKTDKIVILMTDGENTITSNGNSNDSYYSGVGYVWQNRVGVGAGSTDAQRGTALDGKLTTLCNNMKAAGIIIYTIRVEVTSSTSNVLQNCASSADKFYDVANSANLDAVFQTIAGQIANLHLSK